MLHNPTIFLLDTSKLDTNQQKGATWYVNQLILTNVLSLDETDADANVEALKGKYPEHNGYRGDGIYCRRMGFESLAKFF